MSKTRLVTVNGSNESRYIIQGNTANDSGPFPVVTIASRGWAEFESIGNGIYYVTGYGLS